MGFDAARRHAAEESARRAGEALAKADMSLKQRKVMLERVNRTGVIMDEDRLRYRDLHFCPDWDYDAICAGSSEMELCTCKGAERNSGEAHPVWMRPFEQCMTRPQARRPKGWIEQIREWFGRTPEDTKALN